MEVIETTKVNKISGYSLATRVWEHCWNNTKTEISQNVKVFSKYATLDDRVQLCNIWKIGTTFFKRLFMLRNDNTYRGEHNLYEIPFNVTEKHPSKAEISTKGRNQKFLFVRNPYKRVYSGYVDKVMAPNPVFWDFIGVPAIKYLRKNHTKDSIRCGHDLTFKEYVDFVILTLLKSQTKVKGKVPKSDSHSEVMNELCKPCAINYTFIGKMETFARDSTELVRQLGMNKTERLLAEKGEFLAADDAIKDTSYQPFDPIFKKGFSRCVSKRKTLEMAWLKLQARGLIGRQKMSISDTQVTNLTYAVFLRMAREARFLSTPKERKDVKNEHFNKMFDTISLDQLEKLRQVYVLDFKLFEYDDRPEWLFARPRKQY